MHNQKGFAHYILVLIIAGVVATVVGLYVVKRPFGPSLSQTPSQKACTLEAKVCPDGSSVGRSGPNCEFAACPSAAPSTQPTQAATSSADMANWKKYSDKLNRFTFKYPADLLVKESASGNGKTTYIDLSKDKNSFRFEIGPKEENFWYEHFQSKERKILNGISWTVIPTSSYCDADCGTTPPSYYLVKDNYYIAVIDSKNTQISDSLTKIVATIQFN
jgi:hypothetical protein